MKCDRCDNEANIEIYMTYGDEEKKLSLCFDCYQEIVNKGMKDFMESSVSKLLDRVFEETSLSSSSDFMIDYDSTCHKCHKPIREILENREYGCDYCYSEFSPLVEKSMEIENMVSKLVDGEEGEVTEENKLDEKNEEIKNIKDKIKNKEIELSKSVKEEDYENAALLKKELDKLTEELKDLSIRINE